MFEPRDYPQHFTFIMVNTTLPANIGAAARAIYTMGFEQLTLVDPKHPVDQTSIAMASGATHVLDNTKYYSTLKEALSGYSLVFAASSRSRTLPKPVVTPYQAASISQQFLTSLSSDKAASSSKIAIVFGREDRGLTNEELILADYHIQIPANPTYPVLNVAAAIQVIAASFCDYFTSSRDAVASPGKTPNKIEVPLRHDWDEAAITNAQQETLIEQYLTLLARLQLLDTDHPRQYPARIRRLLSRGQLDVKEYQMLQATLARLQRLLAD